MTPATTSWHNRAIFILTLVFAFLTPIFFLPVFSDFYHLPKTALVALIAAIMVGIKILQVLTEKQLSLELKPGQIPILILLVAYWVSTFIQSPNFVEAIYERTLLVTSLSVIFLISSSSLVSTHIPYLLGALISSGAIISIITIAQVTGINNQLFGASWLANKQWSPAGSSMAVIALLLISAVLSSVKGFREQQIFTKALLFTAVVLQGIAIIVLAIELMPENGNPKLLNLPYGTGYAIAIDTLKNWRTALFGVGPGNFLAAFTFFKPDSYNQSDVLWNIRFATSSNELYHTMTITGIVGLAGLILTILYLGKNAISQLKHSLEFSLATALLILSVFIMPFNATMLTVLFIFLIAHVILSPSYKLVEFKSAGTRLGGILVLVILAGASLYYTGQFLIADAYYYQGVQAVGRNEGKTAYDNQVQAIRINNRKSSYYVTFSQTNLLLANALARKENLTDEDKSTILRLVQQAIDSGRTAVALNPQNANSWENLANIYRQLINFANRADAFASQSYGLALRLDPKNPRLWVDYGGLLTSLKDYENASIAFRQAVSLKGDYANAHYNLANTYKLQNKPNLAYTSLQRVLAIISQNSEQYKQVQKEAEELAKQLGQQPGQTGGNNQQPGSNQTVQTPSPAPQRPNDISPINLPENAAPNTINPAADSKLPIPNNDPTPNPEAQNNPGAAPVSGSPTPSGAITPTTSQ